MYFANINKTRICFTCLVMHLHVYVMGVSFTSNSDVFNFMLDLQSWLKGKDKQQVWGCMVVLGCIECGNMMSASCLAQARINHENIHSSFRPQTMQMYCWIVHLNYLTLYWFMFSGISKNVSYSDMLHCMIKPRLDLKSTRWDDCFGI